MKIFFKAANFIIIVGLLNLIAFVGIDDRNEIFWVAYSFIHIAYLLSFIITFFMSKEGKQVLSLPIVAFVNIYFVLELILGTATLFLNFESYIIPLLLQAALFGVSVVMILVNLNLNGTIDQKENLTKQTNSNFLYLKSQIKSVLDEQSYTSPFRKNVEQVYDAIASSPTKSTFETLDLEKDISNKIAEINMSIRSNSEVTAELCNNLILLISERNRRAQLTK